MRDFGGKRSTTWSREQQAGATGLSSGKRTLTEMLPAARASMQRKADAVPPVQKRADVAPAMPTGQSDARRTPNAAPRPTIFELFGGRAQREPLAADPDAEQIHASAQRGITTAAAPLPHTETIQRSFGRHDISGIQALVGGDAAVSARDMGAEAYATGHHAVLGDHTELHTVAHEAAHVVQQRGGVQPKSGGVGEVPERRALLCIQPQR